MQPTPEDIKAFIDALLNDSADAERQLEQFPSLLNARHTHDSTLVHYLATAGETAAVELLLKHGADVNAKNRYGDCALIDTCILGDFETSKVLLSHGANANVLSTALETPLLCAVRTGVPRLVELLINYGADADYKSPGGKTIFDVMPLNSKARLEIYRVLEKCSAAKASQSAASVAE